MSLLLCFLVGWSKPKRRSKAKEQRNTGMAKKKYE